MRKVLGLVAVLLMAFVTVGCEKSMDKIKNKVEESQAEKIINTDENEKGVLSNKKKIEFNNNYNESISDFKEIDKKVEDLDSDGKLEEILLLGKGNITYLDEALFVIREKKSGKILFGIEGDNTQVKIQEVIDIDKDGIKEVLVETNGGGNMPSQTKLYAYDDILMGYDSAEIIKGDLEANLIDQFKVRVIEKNTNTYIEQKVSDKYISNILNSYTTDGNIIRDAERMISEGEGRVKDFDEDGNLEYIIRDYILGGARSDILVTVNTIYRYENGKTKILGIVNESVGKKEFKKYKDEDIFNEEISKKEGEKRAIEVLYDIGALDREWDRATIGEHGTASKHLEKDYYIISAENIHPDLGYDHGICYFVNKKDFSVLTGAPNGMGLEIRKYEN